MVTRVCDEDCNNCVLVKPSPGTRQLTYVLNLALKKFGNEFENLIQKNCPNLTVCVKCRVDDFTHVEGCYIADLADYHG